MKELEHAKRIAKIAGQMMLDAKDESFNVSLKFENDYVTEVDLAIEARIKSEILKIFPGDEILGEEFGTEGKNTRRWILDPIDGTTNFVHRIPFYCVSIAFENNGILEVGVIYAPAQDELFYACRSGAPEHQGAFLNGTQIQVSNTDTMKETVVATGFVTSKQSVSMEENLRLFNAITPNTRAIRRLGSAALDLAYVACGRLDGFWEFDLSPWDIAAGKLIVEQAGGRISTIHNTPHHLKSDSILATNSVIHDDFIISLAKSKI